jgi:hypothetical protein
VLSLGLYAMGLILAAIESRLSLDDLAFALAFLSLQVVAAVLLAFKPENMIGRVMGALGLLVALQVFVDGYAHPGDDEVYPWGGLVLTWMMGHTYIFIFVGIASLFFLFPTGRLAHPRWKYPFRMMFVGLALALPPLYLAPGPLNDEGPIAPDNPANPYSVDTPILDLAAALGLVLILAGVALSVVSLVMRYRSSEGIDRLQMKWVAAGAGGFAILLCVNLVLRNFFTLSAPGEILTSVAFMLIPISIGNAIMRYRLYEIDVFINRALVYAVLTAAIVGAYLGSVVTLQAVLDPVTGDSDLAIAASTLAVAGLFQPMRRRIQGFIDRRFYRSKYDSAQALKAFSSRLRDEIELESVQSDLIELVRSTVQPSHASMWIRPAEAGR